MTEIPQPASEAYSPGDQVRIYLDPADPDAHTHGTVCEITDVLADDLDTETGRPLDAYSYRLRDLESGRSTPSNRPVRLLTRISESSRPQGLRYFGMRVIISHRIAVSMTAGATLRQIAILSAISSGLLAIGALSYLGDPALTKSTLPSRLVEILRLVGSPAKLSAIQPADTFNSTSLPSIGLASLLITWIPQAREIVHAEQEITLTERDAFERFRDRVAALEPPSTASNTPSHGHERTHSINPHLSSSARTDGLTAIKEAYQETVQSTPHYDDQYGEPLAQSMAIEFGEELPTAIMTNSQLTSTLQQAVREAATAASRRRIAFSNRLDEEVATLTDAQQTLTTVREEYEQVTAHPRHQQLVDELQETHQHLTTCIATCENLLDERQTQRTEGHTAIPRTDEVVDLQEYLYRPLDVTYPVLVDGTAVLERCLTARGRVEDDLMHRLQ